MPIVLPSIVESQSSGSPEFILEGSGDARLGGVESYFVYGDLLMNDRQNIDTYVVKDIDGLFDADVRDSREPVPQDHGEHAFDSWYGGRTIVLSGYIRAHNIHKLRDMQEALKQEFVDLQEKPLRIVSPFATTPHHSLPGELEQPSLEINCKKSQPIQMRESQNNFKFNRDFLITLRASDPVFRSSYMKSFSASSATSPTVASLVNIGNYRAAPLITLTGPMTNPVITNDANGEILAITATIGVGQTWILDINERTFKDQSGSNKFSTMSVASDWVKLEPGTNGISITFTGATSATAISITYYDTWI